MLSRDFHLGLAALALSLLSACSRAPACGDNDAIKELNAQALELTKTKLKTRFSIPFLSQGATQALVDFFSPDSLTVSNMRSVSVDKDVSRRRCEATVEYAYSMDGRVETAKKALEHGAVTGQTVAYMLDGEPYLSAVKKMNPKVSVVLKYSTQKTDDGHLHLEIEDADLPLF